MLETKNVLSIFYEGKTENIPICSSIEELEKEFINKFKVPKNTSYYFYYKINNDIEIILTKDSFSDFIELNITTLFADKKKENIISDDVTLNEQKLNSGLDLFIQEIKNKNSKIKLVKKKYIESKEIEINYKIVNENSKEKHIMNEMRLKIKELSDENNKLKEKKERKIITKSTKVISLQYNGQKSEKKEIESLKNEINELKESNNNLKKAFENKEKELIKKNIELTNGNSKLKADNENLNNTIKSLEFIKDEINKEKENLKARNEKLKEKINQLREEKRNLNSELEAKKQIEINRNIIPSLSSSNESTKLDSINKSDSSKQKQKKRNKIKILNKLYQQLKERNLNSSNNMNDRSRTLDSSMTDSLNASQIDNNKEEKTLKEKSVKIMFFEIFREKLSKYKKNK